MLRTRAGDSHSPCPAPAAAAGDLHDVQSERDGRGIEIDQVGISGLRYPVTFDDGDLRQQGIADVMVTARLQHDRRGTHMSRMVALVHEFLQDFDPRAVGTVLKAGAAALDTPGLSMHLSTSVAHEVVAPASGIPSWAVHDVLFAMHWDAGRVRLDTAVTCEVTSLCPCSKHISDYGAHNQRSEVTLRVTGEGDSAYPARVRELVGLATACSSAPVVPLVKRPDERVLTMQAYDNPVFVEDMAREVSAACRSRDLAHRVTVRNLESIHSHDAVAVVNG
ncbi:GTP cyclohydrolase, FolE2/MptA family [Streptomyces sp. HNM0645]|uniref:GTP cyclohydrolase I FolE2 n=1 Tax=Streptomyces sp. HNM0645 TaxID=2782343 RepID=UPI0024B67481|nr:GTP cyclohydrolase, FolE2/MptA family [Streptomyces sp. HNM0645]MDI9884688.1 GTP cyclohydrolase, FolE2/MptA family [Streptomyces sp. HNM0645]